MKIIAIRNSRFGAWLERRGILKPVEIEITPCDPKAPTSIVVSKNSAFRVHLHFESNTGDDNLFKVLFPPINAKPELPAFEPFNLGKSIQERVNELSQETMDKAAEAAAANAKTKMDKEVEAAVSLIGAGLILFLLAALSPIDASKVIKEINKRR